MKICIKDLKPNPYKKEINEGKLNESKIEMLKESIKKDGFWDNIICRKNNGHYELAYGHHRIEAARQVLGKDYTVNIPCKNLSDENMLRILGNENNYQNEEFAIYQIDQVLVVKKFLESHFERPCSGRPSYGGDRRSQEIGVRQISEFLGETNWSKTKVAQLLRMNETLHPEILKDIENSGNKGKPKGTISKTHAVHLTKMKNKKEQLATYKTIKKHGLSERQTKTLVQDKLKLKKMPVSIRDRKEPPIEAVVKEVVKKLNDIRTTLLSITPHRIAISGPARLFLDECLEDYRNIINDYFKKGA